MVAPVKLGAVLALSLTALIGLTGCAWQPQVAPSVVEPVSGTSSETPPPVSPPANAGASVSGHWDGYWTWDAANRKWFWTWVWYDGAGSYGTS